MVYIRKNRGTKKSMKKFQKQIHQKFPRMNLESVYKTDMYSLFEVLIDLYFNTTALSLTVFTMDTPAYAYMRSNGTFEYHYQYSIRTTVALKYNHLER